MEKGEIGDDEDDDGIVDEEADENSLDGDDEEEDDNKFNNSDDNKEREAIKIEEFADKEPSSKRVSFSDKPPTIHEPESSGGHGFPLNYADQVKHLDGLDH